MTTASLALHGCLGRPFSPAVPVTAAARAPLALLLNRAGFTHNLAAINARKMAARTIRKMQVPVYWPVEVGVQVTEKRGVVAEVKKVIAMLDMPIIVSGPVEDVEVGIAMPDIDMPLMLVDVVIDIDMSMAAAWEGFVRAIIVVSAGLTRKGRPSVVEEGNEQV